MFTRKIAALISAALMLTVVGCDKNEPPPPPPSESVGTAAPPAEVTGLEVTFFDVGKADAMVLLSENSTVIIDCGEKGDAKQIVKFLEERGRDTVDYLILTHYDKDHVGGAGKVIRSLDVKNVLGPDHEQQSDEVDKYIAALNEKELTPQLLTEDISFTLDGMDFTVDAPDKTNYGVNDDNDFSLVTKVVHGENTLIFAGDAMEQRLNEVMGIGDCDLLKVPYHGRKLANFGDFLDAVTPEYAVVCTSKEEFAGTIQKQMIKRDITYFSTCFNGRITAVSDGKSLTVTPEKGV
ncbi:MAG: MBL fold metallo-hydrolase [Ruminococcus sp.]|nr:MBL fold metallo-hydrolase [Ruminococcus sp.]